MKKQDLFVLFLLSQREVTIVHEFHRKRLRERYLKCGFESFADHELLELLLSYAIPRKDTNAIAHTLLQKFGSLRNVLLAELPELLSVDGMGESSAICLKLHLEMLRRTLQDETRNRPRYDSVIKLAEFLCPQFVCATHEMVYAMLLDNGMRLLECFKVTDGIVNAAEVTVRRIAERAYHMHAANVVLAHNHPNGLAIPSAQDIEFTDCLNESLRTLGIVLVEHFVIVDERFAPIMRQGATTMHCKPNLDRANDRFYEKFYEGSESGALENFSI